MMEGINTYALVLVQWVYSCLLGYAAAEDFYERAVQRWIPYTMAIFAFAANPFAILKYGPILAFLGLTGYMGWLDVFLLAGTLLYSKYLMLASVGAVAVLNLLGKDKVPVATVIGIIFVVGILLNLWSTGVIV